MDKFSKVARPALEGGGVLILILGSFLVNWESM